MGCYQMGIKTLKQIEEAIKKANLFFYFFSCIGALAALIGTVVANLISIAVMFFALAIMAFQVMAKNTLLLEMKRMSGEE